MSETPRNMQEVAKTAETDRNPSVVEVIKQLQQSGLTNLEGIIRQSIESSQFAVRGGAAANLTMMARAPWTFISSDYVYTGGGSASRLW